MASYGQRFGTFPRRSQRQNPGEGTAREAGKEGGQKLGIRNVPRLCAGTVRAQQGTEVWPPAGVRLDGVTPVDVQEWGIRKYPGALGQSRRLPICGCSERAGGMKC